MIIKGKRKLAGALGVSRNTIDEWIVKGLPVIDDDSGKYSFSLPAVMEWREMQEGRRLPPMTRDEAVASLIHMTTFFMEHGGMEGAMKFLQDKDTRPAGSSGRKRYM